MVFSDRQVNDYFFEGGTLYAVFEFGFLELLKALGYGVIDVANRNESMDYRKIITIEPGKRGGKPCIRGLRITVYEVLEYLASGMTTQEILADFPDLTEEDIRACLSYAADRDKKSFAANE